MTAFILRYTPGTDLARRFPLTRYPWRGKPFATREDAEALRVLMANADHIETVPAVQTAHGWDVDEREEES